MRVWIACTLVLMGCGVDALNGFPCDFEGRCPGSMHCEADSRTCIPGAECFAPEVDCGGSCELLSSSARNCGACGRSCGSGESCVNGSCVPGTSSGTCEFCAPGLECVNGQCTCGGRGDLCGGSICIDLQQSVISCGMCFHGCFGEANHCSNGVCVCAQDEKQCGTNCFNVATDPANCGDCGRACATGQKCEEGRCVTACTQNTTNACGDGRCWNLQSDREHCGNTCSSCDESEVCVGGACTCPTGATACGGSCTDPRVDPRNCGSCGTTCVLGETCIGGQCACQPGLERCSGECRLLFDDPQNCGACGRACAAGEKCSEGSCKATCPLLMQACDDGACADTQRDPRNCGGCGDQCGPGETCADGDCVPQRPALGCTSCPCDDCTFTQDALCCVRAGVPFCFDARRCPP